MSTNAVGNKGEWSEFYVLLCILSNGYLTIGSGEQYLVTRVFDESTPQHGEFVIADGSVCLLGPSGLELSNFTQEECKLIAQEVLRHIRLSSGSFPIQAASDFIASHGLNGMRTQRSGKSDIELQVYDPQTKTSPRLGFSIKSLLGSKPTLFNANADTTNFVYVVEGCLDKEAAIEEVNRITGKSKYKDRVAKILSLGGKFRFHDVASGILALNLQVIDSRLPEILACMILNYYSGSPADIPTLVNRTSAVNPCGFDISHNHPYYERKIKAFLRDSALGMTASALWSGKLETTGGYIVVDRNGALHCTHTSNMNFFEDYLFNATALESPSSRRHHYGELYEAHGQLHLKLPLQVRFRG